MSTSSQELAPGFVYPPSYGRNAAQGVPANAAALTAAFRAQMTADLQTQYATELAAATQAKQMDLQKQYEQQVAKDKHEQEQEKAARDREVSFLQAQMRAMEAKLASLQTSQVTDPVIAAATKASAAKAVPKSRSSHKGPTVLELQKGPASSSEFVSLYDGSKVLRRSDASTGRPKNHLQTREQSKEPAGECRRTDQWASFDGSLQRKASQKSQQIRYTAL